MHHFDFNRLIFLDETGLNTKMENQYGYAPIGKRCCVKVPHGHWNSTTLIAAMTCNEVIAPMLFDGPMDGPSFAAWFETQLSPCLKPNDIVFLDNLASHLNEDVKRLAAAKGAYVIPLPEYSPDLNPIEKVWSKIKAFIRAIGPRTFSALKKAVRMALDTVTASDCLAFYNHIKTVTI